MSGHLIQFVKENKKFIIENNLKENLLLHLICVFEYGQVDKIGLVNTIDLMLQGQGNENDGK